MGVRRNKRQEHGEEHGSENHRMISNKKTSNSLPKRVRITCNKLRHRPINNQNTMIRCITFISTFCTILYFFQPKHTKIDDDNNTSLVHTSSPNSSPTLY